MYGAKTLKVQALGKYSRKKAVPVLDSNIEGKKKDSEKVGKKRKL